MRDRDQIVCEGGQEDGGFPVYGKTSVYSDRSNRPDDADLLSGTFDLGKHGNDDRRVKAGYPRNAPFDGNASSLKNTQTIEKAVEKTSPMRLAITA